MTSITDCYTGAALGLAIAWAILSNGREPEGAFIAEVAREFVAWFRSQENDRVPDRTCMAACRELARDFEWSAPDHNNAKGCGTAMRSAPIGLTWHGDEERIVRLASQVSELIHGHHTATAGGVATALLAN